MVTVFLLLVIESIVYRNISIVSENTQYSPKLILMNYIGRVFRFVLFAYVSGSDS